MYEILFSRNSRSDLLIIEIGSALGPECLIITAGVEIEPYISLGVSTCVRLSLMRFHQCRTKLDCKACVTNPLQETIRILKPENGLTFPRAMQAPKITLDLEVQ
jgi:hypothetical protein